jgi:hypothetical protein
LATEDTVEAPTCLYCFLILRYYFVSPTME